MQASQVRSSESTAFGWAAQQHLQTRDTVSCNCLKSQDHGLSDPAVAVQSQMQSMQKLFLISAALAAALLSAVAGYQLIADTTASIDHHLMR